MTIQPSSTRYITAQDANTEFDQILCQVSAGSEHVAIQGPGVDPVYLISHQDYQLFQQLLEQLEDQQDLEQADTRMQDPQQELMEFDTFFATLDNEDGSVPD